MILQHGMEDTVLMQKSYAYCALATGFNCEGEFDAAKKKTSTNLKALLSPIQQMFFCLQRGLVLPSCSVLFNEGLVNSLNIFRFNPMLVLQNIDFYCTLKIYISNIFNFCCC